MSTDASLTLDLATLPDDPVLLKHWVLEREQRLIEYKQRLAEREALIERIREEAAEQLEAQRERLEAEKQAAIVAILRRYYSPRNERFDPRQLLLFGQRIESLPLDEGAIAEEAREKLVTRRIKKRHNHGRSPLPDHLPRIEIEHDLTDEEKKCPCCGEVRGRIGQEISEQLEYFPANFKVFKHIRHKYACGQCEHDGYNPNITTAAKPPQPIAKGLPGPSLLAYVITSKLGDHLPLYRLENIFARQQVEIARSTLCAWLASAGELVRPLVELMEQRIRLSQVIHTDDTTVPVQSPGELKCRKGRIWTYLGDGANPYIVYDYTPDRTRAGPVNWLRDYQGYLQADAYGGYDGIYHSGAKEVACWAHARRKFFDAQETDGKRAAQMLTWVRELYAVEDQARELTDEARRDLRQTQSVPVLAKIKAWLDAEGPLVLPRSEMGKAFTYTLNQWDSLCRYTTEGFLNIDNNAAERALKRVAIGRKNWLFAGNDYAGGTAARLYSLIASAERHGLDPQRYLTSVLAKLPSTPAAELDQFLPDVWKWADAAEPLAPAAG
jgi:transposase